MVPNLDESIRFLFNFNPWWSIDYPNNDPDLIKLKNVKFIRKVDWFNDLKDGVYILRGPRQVGKTTAIKQKILELSNNEDLNSILYINATNLLNKELEQCLIRFLELNKFTKYIFIDEISYVENWSKLIKSISDLGLFRNKIVILTGSNTLDMRYEYETMPGRTGNGRRIIAKPMTFEEYYNLLFPEIVLTKEYILSNIDLINAKFEEYILTGGLPFVINNYLETGFIDDNIYDIYIKWVLGDIEKYSFKANTGKTILRKIIETLSSKISWSTLTQYADVSHHTVKEYVDVFERSFLNLFIYNSEDGIINTKKMKKIYFIDSFFYFAIYKWVYGEINMFQKSLKLISDDEFMGKIKENVFASHIWQNFIDLSDTIDYKNKFYFFSPKKGKEIDFVINHNDKILNLEVKSKDSNRKDAIILTKKAFFENKIPLTMFLLDDYKNRVLGVIKK
jgi:hypothetical protein